MAASARKNGAHPEPSLELLSLAQMVDSTEQLLTVTIIT
ncbi:hypothetical protein A2U01_0073450 [Trifolium medium]|uniref:Uncharacterized protein n=1 Tax=Trifolium medium TaxID=97028 RepID=A0A392SWF4_9FABA|nr:hypothetical protein [Trifolium medium]